MKTHNVSFYVEYKRRSPDEGQSQQKSSNPPPISQFPKRKDSSLRVQVLKGKDFEKRYEHFRYSYLVPTIHPASVHDKENLNVKHSNPLQSLNYPPNQCTNREKFHNIDK